ncbi:endonuclease/exonuclease/phosphatase family protein [Nocardia sp. NPDC057668]|uniref:endonuclease/exonuclease/phosphatase family protein n=1 Tax=Nocardia sp. NPDC057668 TaxID=3346202 RepID=UPI00366DB2BE
MTVASWNVLHRVHADNWASEIAGRWPDETDRIAAVTALVAGRADQVIALQEVSGDQLADLRKSLPERTFHTLRYPRVPRPKQVASQLSEGFEALVLIVDGPSRTLAAEPFDNDPGNGALVVEVAGVRVIATHVTGDNRRNRQFARLAELATPGPAVLLGDFNADSSTVATALGADFEIAVFAPDGPATRPRTTTSKSQFIDHVITRGLAVREAAVVPVAGVSDHNLVRAAVG